MFKNTGFSKSLKNAVSGFLCAVKSERNLRFHIFIANLICLFAVFFGLTRAEWGVLILTASAVISAELFNTAIENTVDTATNKICESARLAKDISSAAVTVTALTSLIVGVFLFGDLGKIKAALSSLFGFAFSGAFPFLLLFSVLIFNIWLLFFCGRKKG